MVIIYLKFHEIPSMCFVGVALTKIHGQTDGVISIYPATLFGGDIIKLKLQAL